MNSGHSTYDFNKLDRRNCIRMLSAGALSIPAAANGANVEARSLIKAIPIALNDDRLWTTLRIKQAREIIAVFDTGSHTDVIAAKLVGEHKLRQLGTGNLVGLGGYEASNVYAVGDVTFGRTYKEDMIWAQSSPVLDATPFKYLVGCQSLTYGNSELDLVRMQWRKGARATALLEYANSLDDQGPYQPIDGSYRLLDWARDVQLTCTVEGLSGQYLVDTGSPTNFVVGGKATKALGKWITEQPYAPWRISGFGRKRMQSRLYRVGSARFAGGTLENPLILLSNPATIDSQIEGYAGLIGMRAMGMCNMLFDRDNLKLWLRPNGGAGLSDPVYPMSGMWIERSGDRITVDEVSPQSPAALAGVAEGDVIIGADWSQILQAINGKAGTVVQFELERGGKRRSVEFILRPFL